MPSFFAAFERIGSTMPMPCAPPGARCDVFGGVLVSTVRPRQRIVSGW